MQFIYKYTVFTIYFILLEISMFYYKHAQATSVSCLLLVNKEAKNSVA